MDKNLQLNLKINADTTGLNRALAGVGAGARRVRVPVDLETGGLSGAGQQIGKSFQSEAAKVRVGLRTEQASEIGNVIAKSVVKGVEDSLQNVGRNIARGNAFGAIASIAATPFRIAGNVASSVIGGALNSTRAAATSAIEGLINGIGIEVTKGLGEGLRQGVEQRIADTFGSTEVIGRTAARQLLDQLGNAARSIERQVESADSPFRGITQVIKSEFQRLIETAFDPQEVLAVSRAAQRRARQQRGQTEADAADELLTERQQAVRNLNDTLERTVVLRARTQADYQATQEIARRELPGLEATISGVTEQAAVPTRRLEDVNAERQQLIDERRSAPREQLPRIRERFAALSQEARQLEAQIAQIQAEGQRAGARAEQITQKLERLEETNRQIDAVRAQAIAQARQAIEQQRTLGTPEERRTQAEAQLAETRRQAEAAEQRQREIIEQRNRGREVGQRVAIAAQAAFDEGNQERFLDLSAEADLALKIITQLDTEFEELGETRKALDLKAQRLQRTLDTLPQGLPDAVRQAYLDLAGKLPAPEDIPAIRERTTETLGSAAAAFGQAENTIAFRRETLAAIESGQRLTEQQLKELYEEVAHSLQFDFGRLSDDSFRRLAPDATPAQIEPILQELQGYSPEQRPYELDAKLIRDQAVAAALVRQELQELTDSVGGDGAALYKMAADRLNAAQREVADVVARSQAEGLDFNPAPLQEFIQKVGGLARETTAEFARLSIEDFDTDRLKGLSTDIKKTLQYLDVVDQEVAAAGARQTAAPGRDGGALAIAREKAADLGGIVQQVGGALAPVVSFADGAANALAVVGKAGLALADRFGFVAASFIPGGALAYGPAKAVVRNVVGPMAAAGVASQIPGVGEVLGVLQSAIGALIGPETVGLSSAISADVTAQIASALPSLFGTLSRELAQSGLPGAGLSAQAVDAVGGLLVHTLEPLVNGVASAADSTITAVGTAAQDLLSQLATALVAGKVVQEGARLATSEEARAGALQGIETIGSGIGQVVTGVQGGIEDAQDAIDRTRRAVQKNIEGVKAATERVGQGDTRAVGDAVDQTQAAISNLTRGVQDVAKASTEAIQNVAEGTAKVVGVLGDLRSVKLPDGLNLVDLAQDQLIRIQAQLRQKLENVLAAEAAGTPVVGGSGVVARDLEIVGQVLEAKYEVVIESVGDQVQKQIAAAPLDVPVKIEPLELEPIVVQPRPVPQSMAAGQGAGSGVTGSAQDISPIQDAQDLLRAGAQPRPIDLLGAVDAAIAETDIEIREVYGYFSEIIDATKKAIKKGDVDAIAQNTSEAKRIAAELAQQISDVQLGIAESIQQLEASGVEVSPTSAIGERLRRLKSALGQKQTLIPQRLASIGATIEPVIEGLDQGVAQQINPALAQISEGLNQKARELKAALANLVEAARTNPRVASTARDVAVIGAGMAASASVADHGQVASLAAELVAMVSARGALSVGGESEAQSLVGAIERLTARLNDPAVQQSLGDGLFGDILGSATAHITDAMTGVPGSGAVAANLVVPQLQRIRGRSQPIEGIDLNTAANRNAEVEAALDDLQQIAAAADQVDATVGDRIALFFLSLQQAFAKAPNPTVSQDVVDSLTLLEIGLKDAGSGISAEASQAIAQSEQAISDVERQLRRLEAQAEEAERLAQRVETLVGERELALPPSAEEFDQRLAAAGRPGVNDPAEIENQRLRLEQERLEQLAEVQARIQRLYIDIDANLAQGRASKALVVSDGLAGEAEIREAAQQTESLSKALIVYDAELAQAQKDANTADAQLLRLLAQMEALRARRDALEKEVQGYQVEDLSAFLTQRPGLDTGSEQVQRARLAAQSERAINDALQRGTVPTGTPDDLQNMADSAIASFDRNAAKFEAAAAQLESGGTRAQRAFRAVGDGAQTLKQKLAEAGGIPGVFSRIGQAASDVAVQLGLPVGALGKIGGLIKGVGIAALGFFAINSFGDALVNMGRAAFDSAVNMERLQTRLTFVAGGETAAGEDLAYLREQSERLKQPLQSLIQSYTQFKIASKDTALEGERTRQAFEGLQVASTVYGLTLDETSRVTAQVSQVFRKQRADTEDLKTIAEAGISIFDALGKVMGKSGADLQKAIENGEVTSLKLAEALKLVGDQAEEGLPAALETAAKAIANLQRVVQDLGEKVGPAILGGFSVGVDGIIGGIRLLEDVGGRVAPIFDAIGQGAGLVAAAAGPIVGVVGSISGAIGGDLLDGVAIPFQVIAAGLSQIRDGFTQTQEIASVALGIIGQQAQGLVSAVPVLGMIAEYANPAEIAVRALGLAIGVYLVAQMVKMSVTIGQVVVKALLSMATTMTATVIPAIASATTASLAFVATPLGATLLAIGVAAAIAAPHLDDLAIAMSGVGEAQLRANNRAIAFNDQYQDGLKQLQKGIPLTVEELKKLKDGFAQNVSEGKDSAEVAQALTQNLDRLQASAEAAARIQQDLAKALSGATAAIKSQSKAIDADYSDRLAGLNKALADQSITRERFDQAELDAQADKSAKYQALYDEQAEGLRKALATAQSALMRPMPEAVRTEVVKQVETLQDQIFELEAKGNEQRIALDKSRVKVQEDVEKDRAQRAENAQKVIENQVAAGLKTEADGAAEIGAIKEGELRRRLQILDRQIQSETTASGKLTEIGVNLASERKVLESDLTKFLAEESQKRYELALRDIERRRDETAAAITEAETETLLEIQALQSQGLLNQAAVEANKAEVTKNRLKLDLQAEKEHIRQLEALPDSNDPEKERETQKQIQEARLKTAQLTLQISEQEFQVQQKLREIALSAIDERQRQTENAAASIEQLAKLSENVIERQNKLLEAQKGLRGSIQSLQEEATKILTDGEEDEEKKAKILEDASKRRLDALKETQRIEQQILDLQLEQERVQSRVAIIQAQAAVAKAQAEEEKLRLNPEATEAERQAAAISTSAASLELGALVEAAALQDQLAQTRRQQAQVENQRAQLGARFELAQARTDPRQREREIQLLERESRQILRTPPRVLPIGNRLGSSQPDYTQVDRAAEQLGLIPRGANLGRFSGTQPVDLHSGASQIQGLNLGSLSEELRMARQLTQSGVVGNLVKLVEQNKTLSTQLLGIANRRPQVNIQNINNKRPANTESFAGLPL